QRAGAAHREPRGGVLGLPGGLHRHQRPGAGVRHRLHYLLAPSAAHAAAREPMMLARALLAMVLLAAGIATAQAQTAAKPYRIYAITFRGMTDVEKGFQDYFA